MNYALIVGIEDYYELTPTIYAENDARDFNEILINTMDFKTKTLLGSEASLQNIKKQFQIIMDKINQGDKFYFFFAGHGINFNGTPRISCYDTYYDELENTTLSIESMLGEIEKKKCSQSIFFIDACESTISFEGRNLRARKISQKDIEDLQKKSEYTFVFSAASVSGTASVMEDDTLGHGIFSYYLLEAFRGNTVEALDGTKLTNTSLANYLTYKIKEYCSTRSHKQVAYCWGKAQSEFLIFDYSQRQLETESKVFINDIYFGVIDADNEYNKDLKAFKENFYDLNDTVQKIIKDKTKFIVLGKKGTGKTYIGKYLEMESEITKDINAKYVNFQTFDYIKFDSIKDSKADTYEKYSTAWEWIIFTHLSKLIIDKLPNDSESLDDLKYLYKGLLGEGEPNFRRLINNRLKRGISLDEKFEKYIGKDESGGNSHYKLQDIVELLDILLSEIRFSNDKQYFLVLDGLDEKIKNDKTYKDSLNGLLWTIYRLNNDFNNSDLPIKIVIFLRNNVYEFVSGANVNKLNLGNTVHLTWNSDSQDKFDFPLADFINKRIANSLKNSISSPVVNPLKLILPFEIKSNSKAEAKEPWGWILDFTTYKPRDVIQYFNSCQMLCNNSDEQLNAKILWAALKEYSSYLVREFKDELFGFYTDEQIKELFSEILPKMGKKRNSFNEMKILINKSVHCNTLKPEELLNTLYGIGLLGVFESDFAHWAYRTKTVKIFVPENCKYLLHSGVWKALSIW